MKFLLATSAFLLSLHAAIFLAVAVRVVMRRSARGIALSWLLLVATLPYAGALIYLLMKSVGSGASGRAASMPCAPISERLPRPPSRRVSPQSTGRALPPNSS
jgi:Phospholipase_D-nuclease N-terminal